MSVDTVRVRRGGSYLTISKDSVERYLAKGFDIVDDNGNVIKDSIPNNVDALKAKCAENFERIKALEYELMVLKAKLEAKDTTATPAPTTPKKRKKD